MISRKTFSTKVVIEKVNEKLSDDNRLICEHEIWRELWASVLLKDMSTRRILYLFVIKTREDFPSRFRVKIGSRIFVPTQSAVYDQHSDSVLFHAVLVHEK